MKIKNVVLYNKPLNCRWNVEIKNARIQSITPSIISKDTEVEPPGLIIPSLCHPHIHLDKPYLLTSNSHLSTGDPIAEGASSSPIHPDYSDLIPSEGTFSEALSKTAQAKSRYTVADLILRGSQLVANSINAGVTDIRAFVEIDHVTKTKCIEAAVTLKHQFSHLCRIQIVAFAQDPIFSTEHGEENRKGLEKVLDEYGDEIEVLGTTPYVEQDFETGLRNVQWAIETATQRKLNLDFHLDYNLDANKQAMIWDVVRLLKEAQWVRKAEKSKTIVLGHCTRMTLLSNAEMTELAKQIQEAHLPISFIGLPTSDLFMMGRPDEDSSQSGTRSRGTLQILDMIQRYKMQACIGVNNVGNAFTPWGSGDPLHLASLGVGIYQAGTEEDARLLYECVSTRARKAIGLTGRQVGKEIHADADDSEEEQESLLLVRNEELIECMSYLKVRVPARQYLSMKDVVWDPPEMRQRENPYQMTRYVHPENIRYLV